MEKKIKTRLVIIRTHRALRSLTGQSELAITRCNLYLSVDKPYLECGNAAANGSCNLTGITCLAFIEATAFARYSQAVQTQ